MKSRKIKKQFPFLEILVACCLALPRFMIAAEEQMHWPSFRGSQARGTAVASQAPLHWNVAKSESVPWKRPIPGLSHAGPVIWGDQLFAISAVKTEGESELKIGLYGEIRPVQEQVAHRWQLFCLDKKTGEILWERVALETAPSIQRHPKSSHANSTPATDGQRVVCLFGSEGMFCYDLEGQLKWQKSLGPLDSGYFRAPTAQWGFASSPIIHDGRVYVQCDVQTNSFLAAYALSDGKEIWRTPRQDVPTWSTPTIHIGEERAQIIVNGYRHAGGYDLRTGQELWKITDGGDIPVPTPVVAHGLAFLTSAHGRWAPIYAVRLGAEGNITLPSGETRNEWIAWSVPRRGNYMQTPLVAGDYLYCCNDAGVLTCYSAKTGEVHYSERLGRGGQGFTASGIALNDQLYFTSEPGLVYVIRAGPKFEVLATNELGETCMATPAISEGRLYFRTRNQIVAVGR